MIIRMTFHITNKENASELMYQLLIRIQDISFIFQLSI